MSIGPEGVRFLQARCGTENNLTDEKEPAGRINAGRRVTHARLQRTQRRARYILQLARAPCRPESATGGRFLPGSGPWKEAVAVRFFPDRAAFHGNRYVRTILLRFLTMQPANGSRRGLVLPPQPDRGDEFVAAIVARPSVADAAFEIKLGLFGHKQHTPAMRAVGSAEIFSRGAERGFLCATGRLDGHRRSSSTHPLRSPISPDISIHSAQGLWRCCDAFVKLLWRRHAAVQRGLPTRVAATSLVKIDLVTPIRSSPRKRGPSGCAGDVSTFHLVSRSGGEEPHFAGSRGDHSTTGADFS
jgi:hypothetical protein